MEGEAEVVTGKGSSHKLPPASLSPPPHFSFYLFQFIFTYVLRDGVYHGMRLEVQGQLLGVGSLFL